MPMPVVRRSRSELHPVAPPPSPIPTGKGSRSAANDTLVEYLQKSIHVPQLTLPIESQLPDPEHVPSEIDLASIVSRDRKSLDGMIRSAREFGAFMVTGHGISLKELLFLVDDELRDCSDNRVHVQIATWVVRSTGDVRWEGKRPGFSSKMENVARKLDTIARHLGRVLEEITGSTNQTQKRIQGENSVLSLFRFNHSHKAELLGQPSSACDHILCLHLPRSPSQLFVQTVRGTFSFDAGPETILVALGKRLEEWSPETFRGVAGEVVCEPFLQENEVAFSLEFKCLSLEFDHLDFNSSESGSVLRVHKLIHLHGLVTIDSRTQIRFQGVDLMFAVVLRYAKVVLYTN